MKTITILVAGLAGAALVGCSGGSGRSSGASSVYAPSAVQFATGPIFSACLAAGRKEANRARCGCVQAVANQSLASDEQRRGVGFFKDPHQAQVVRTSDRASDEQFWLRWKAYSDEAARICT